MKQLIRVLTFSFVCAASLELRAETSRTIDSAEIQLGDVISNASDETKSVGLGKAPPPGASRLMSKSEIVSILEAQKVSTEGLKIPDSVRIVRSSRRFTQKELEKLVSPAIGAAIPRGVRIEKLEIRRGLTLPPSASAAAVKMPKLPKKAGKSRITVTVEVTHDDSIVARIPVSLNLDISEEASKAAVERGARVDLVIERGPARITAAAIAMTDGDIGEVIQFKVESTRKMVSGRVESTRFAKVVTR
jgi:hypothetical protein